MTIQLKTAAEVAAYIAATTAQAIANKGVDGHDLDTVMGRVTADRVLSQIHSAYLRRVRDGQHRPTAMTKIGANLITEYRTHYGI